MAHRLVWKVYYFIDSSQMFAKLSHKSVKKNYVILLIVSLPAHSFPILIPMLTQEY